MKSNRYAKNAQVNIINHKFHELKKINTRRRPFQYYTAEALRTNKHTARQMLNYHLSEEVDAASRNEAFIEKYVTWIADYFMVGNQIQIAGFGCGPGLYGSQLAEKGQRSPASIF